MWDIDLFIGADIFTPGAIYSANIIKQALALLTGRQADGSVSWHDLPVGIALATQNTGAQVTHLPRVLYHRAAMHLRARSRASLRNSVCRLLNGCVNSWHLVPQ